MQNRLFAEKSSLCDGRTRSHTWALALEGMYALRAEGECSRAACDGLVRTDGFRLVREKNWKVSIGFKHQRPDDAPHTSLA